MAIINAQLGKHADALTMWEDMLQVQVKTLGLEHPDVASAYNNIGEVYRHQAKYLEALEMYDKSLKIKSKVYDLDHPVVADTKVCRLNTWRHENSVDDE